jgi:NTE family protein
MTTRSQDERAGGTGRPGRPSRRAGTGWSRRKASGRRVAFVLSGGGNLGALQVGMLRALLEHDIVPDLLVGCSVGAINGAGFADDPTPAGVDHMEEVWRALEGSNLLPSGWLPNAVALARRGEAVHDHQGLRSMAEDSLRSTTFEELTLPFQCVATDVVGVREVWFSSGPLVPALLASAALPAVYPAVEIDGVRYLDGGIVDDVPVSRAVELGATTIYVLQVGSFSRPRPEPRRPLDVAIQSYWIARHYRFKRDLVNMPEGVEVHVLPAGDRPRMRFNDFTHTGTLIDGAYAATSAYLDDRAAGLPAPSIEEALSQVQSSYEPPEAAEGEATPAEPADSRWRRTVAAARRRDRTLVPAASEPDAGAGAPAGAGPGGDGSGNGSEEGAATSAAPVPGDAGAIGPEAEPAPVGGAPPEAGPAEVPIKEDPSRWRRAVGIARRERHADPADPGQDGPEPLEATSGLSTAHAVGARVARILSRGDA